MHRLWKLGCWGAVLAGLLTLGWFGVRAFLDQQARVAEVRAAEEVAKLGGWVERENNDREKPVTLAYLSGTPVKDADLPKLAALPSLRVLRLANTKITDDGLKQLPDFPALETLDLRQTAVTAAGLRHLAGLHALSRLELSDTQMTDEVLRALRETGLLDAYVTRGGEDRAGGKGGNITTTDFQGRLLDLRETRVTDVGLQELAGLKKLNTLYCNEYHITDTGLRHLRAAGLLHTLHTAAGAGGSRPDGAAQVVSLDLWPSVVAAQEAQLTPVGLKELGELKALRWLNLSRGTITDEALHTLRDIGLVHALSLTSADPVRWPTPNDKRPASPAEVRSVDLGGTKITDAGLKELAAFDRLQLLNLSYTRTTDAGLAALTGLTHLQSLELISAKVGDAGMKHLAALKQLRRLTLTFTRVSDAGLKELAPLTELRWLSLYGTAVSDAGLEEVARFTQLEELVLCDTRVGDAGMKHLARLKHLQELNLNGTDVGDAGLKELAGLTSLRVLHLHNTRVTGAAVAELRRALPNLKIS